MRTLGIDVSHWEGVIDWKITAPTIGFAYYKCTDGINFTDPQFENNKRGCAINNLPSAPYHYYQPNLPGEAQAIAFYNKAGKGYKRYIVDVEDKPQPFLPQWSNWSNLLTLLIKLENLSGLTPAIYTSMGYWNEFIGYRAAAIKYDLLLARYSHVRNPVPPAPWKTWKVWQFTDYGFVPGCNEIVDMNWFNGDIPECRNWFGVQT